MGEVVNMNDIERSNANQFCLLFKQKDFIDISLSGLDYAAFM